MHNINSMEKVGKVESLQGNIMTYTVLTKALVTKLLPHGLDLVACVKVRHYNEVVPQELHLSTGSLGDDALAILVGNTAALWEPFLACLRRRRWRPLYKDDQVISSEGGHRGHMGSKSEWGKHPLDCFVMEVVDNAAREVGGQLLGREDAFEIRWVHDTSPGRLVAVQRMAEVAGLAYLDQGTHLSLHATYGPWIAFRAVLLTGDCNGPETSFTQGQPGVTSTGHIVRLQCPASQEELNRAASVMTEGLTNAGRRGAIFNRHTQADEKWSHKSGSGDSNSNNRIQTSLPEEFYVGDKPCTPGYDTMLGSGSAISTHSLCPPAPCIAIEEGRNGKLACVSGSEEVAIEEQEGCKGEQHEQLTLVRDIRADMKDQGAGLLSSLPETPDCHISDIHKKGGVLGGQADMVSVEEGAGSGVVPALLDVMEKEVEGLKDTWKIYLASRDAFQVGRSNRYPQDMIRYHYTHSHGGLQLLEMLVHHGQGQLGMNEQGAREN